MRATLLALVLLIGGQAALHTSSPRMIVAPEPGAEKIALSGNHLVFIGGGGCFEVSTSGGEIKTLLPITAGVHKNALAVDEDDVYVSDQRNRLLAVNRHTLAVRVLTSGVVISEIVVDPSTVYFLVPMERVGWRILAVPKTGGPVFEVGESHSLIAADASGLYWNSGGLVLMRRAPSGEVTAMDNRTAVATDLAAWDGRVYFRDGDGHLGRSTRWRRRQWADALVRSLAVNETGVYFVDEAGRIWRTSH